MSEDRNPYLLDANVLLEAQDKWYPMDICPGFWDSIVEGHAEEMFYSIDMVGLEFENDNVVEWVSENLPRTFFIDAPVDEGIVDRYKSIISWVNRNPQFHVQSHKDKFASGADGWLVAVALEKGYTIVTHEIPVPSNSAKIKIPNVCDHFGVRWINTFEMLKETGTQFVFRGGR